VAARIDWHQSETPETPSSQRSKRRDIHCHAQTN